MTHRFTLPQIWAEKHLRPILDEARKKPFEGAWDSVLAQISTEAFDAARGNAETSGQSIEMRVVIVPAATVPKVHKLIEAERAGKLASVTVREPKAGGSPP